MNRPSWPPLLHLPTQLQRIRAWWHRQTPQRQDRLAMLAPVGAVLLFLMSVVAALVFFHIDETAQEQQAVRRGVEYAQQNLRLRLREHQEQLVRIAREMAGKELSAEGFNTRTFHLIQQYPELQGLTWFDDQQRVKYTTGSSTIQTGMDDIPEFISNALHQARDTRSPIYVLPPAVGSGNPQFLQLYVPLITHNRLVGVLLAEYPVGALYLYGIPHDVASRYAIALHDTRNHLLAGSAITPTHAPHVHTMHMDLTNERILILGQMYPAARGGLFHNGLFWLVVTLTILTAWMLIANWKHTRRRMQTQQVLEQETAFRRAMENSMLTGMRAMDFQGRITYVNPAFCQMTGWSEEELVGILPPFPYWPERDKERLHQLLTDELNGMTNPSGIQVQVKRKNGVLFDARLYVSPLVDATGKQTGWMTSMTDITEPNRVRDQLAASHQRFTTVLEALDASISVAPLGGNEILFANKLYRQWFGAEVNGHFQLLVQAGSIHDETRDQVDSLAGLPLANLSDSEGGDAEIFIPALSKWLEVRSRYLSWVDGRLAQMVIATDITARRFSEEQAALQAERAQTASRLITMGEMASSVAHELNQPLTAINNYCNGMVSRIRANEITQEDLLHVLEKTARQAHRAGQIIHRIRTFVKRSEPNRTPSEVTVIVNEATELAEIEMRRFNVRFSHYVAARLPLLMVDPILIEQVLINLLRNAAQSIHMAHRPRSERNIELRVVPKMVDGKSTIEFTVQDSGQGLSSEVQERLYEAFYSTKADGMGIGLSLCRSIIESHRGRMNAENLYNGTDISGCRFSFWIPTVA